MNRHQVEQTMDMKDKQSFKLDGLELIIGAAAGGLLMLLLIMASGVAEGCW